MAKKQGLGGAFEKVKRKRKGVHAKSKRTKNKGADNYVKPYKGQGK